MIAIHLIEKSRMTRGIDHPRLLELEELLGRPPGDIREAGSERGS
jgi:hypothetical protein